MPNPLFENVRSLWNARALRSGGPIGIRAPWFFLGLLSIALAQCIFDNRQAGTSTSVTNPAAYVTGFAILNDGKPAAGAEITLRKPLIQVSHEGVPASAQVAFAVADSSGKFTVPLVFMEDVYMEIRRIGGARNLPADSQEVHLRRWPNGLPHDGKMGTFRLQSTGTVVGRITLEDPSAAMRRWIGVRGTRNFTAAQDTNPFTLKGVPAGERELVVVSVPDSASWAADPALKITVSDTIAKREVKPAAVTDFGPVFYNDE